MGEYAVVYSVKALKQLKKLGTATDREMIVDAVARLKEWPDVAGVRRLKNHKYAWRLEIGKRKYRALFDVQDAVRLIEIGEVLKRDSRTYKER